jgi:hypothetical protein
MKKLAIIGTAVVALGGPLAQGAGAMPADVSPVVQSPVVVVKSLPAVPLELGSSQRVGVTPAEQRAFTLRGEALNKAYGLGAFAIGPTAAESRADTLRGEALNRKYGLGIGSLTLERGTNERFAANDPTRGSLFEEPSVTSSPDFQWGDAGIGAAALLGLVALVGAGVFEVRQHGRLGTS